MRCPKCKSKLKDLSEPCVDCGYKLPEEYLVYIRPKISIVKLLVVLIAIMLISSCTIAGLFLYFISTEREEMPSAVLSVTTLNDDCVITVTKLSEKLPINSTAWSIEDEHGETIIAGDVLEIYDNKGGYHNDDEGKEIMNTTLYWERFAPKVITYDAKAVIVFQSNRGEWEIDEGDNFYIRGEKNYNETRDGIKGGYSFYLIYKPTKRIIAQSEIRY